MNKLRHYLYGLLLPTLAITCTDATVCAQESVTGPDVLPVIFDPKQIAGLTMA
jgi:hypothetical protein